MEFARLLPQALVLGRRGRGDYVFRLAGGFVRDLHARDLRGKAFTGLWGEADRIKLVLACEAARRRAEPIVASCDVQAGPHRLAMEVLLAPLANREGDVDRFLGLYQPLGSVADLRRLPADILKLTDLSATSAAPPPRLAVLDGRRVG